MGQIQGEHNTAKWKEKKHYLYTELWLCDPLNLEKSSLLQLCQHFWYLPSEEEAPPIHLLHPAVIGATQGWVGERVSPRYRVQTRKTELSRASPGEAALIEMQWFFFDRWTSCYVPTCEDGFVGFKLLSSDVQAAVREARLLPQVPQVVGQLTLRDLQHVHVGLAWNVHRVLDDAYLQGQPDQTVAWQRARDFQQQQQEWSFI